MVELGAGTGRITASLAETGADVVAIELDESYAEVLRRRFAGRSSIRVVSGDVLRVPLPTEPFRVVGNIPFGLTSAILRRLLDRPQGRLRRADLIVQHEVARKRSSAWPVDLLSAGWLPWWEFHLVRRLPRGAFDPPPVVDAAVLSIVRRHPPLLPAERRSEYVRLLRRGFRTADLPIHRALRGILPPRAWKRAARDRGLSPRARVRDLDVFDWVLVFDLVQGGGR